MPSELELLVYAEPALGGRFSPLPGVRLVAAITSLPDETRRYIDKKLWQSCRKLALTWYGGGQALEAEQEFYSQTIREAPALFGEHAVFLHYHLEAFVLLARAAMDVASGAFSPLLPTPFRRKRCDSLNDLIKWVQADLAGSALAGYFGGLEVDPASWFSLLTSVGERRGLRDKVAHQTEFPIQYCELDQHSEKERPVVIVTDEIMVPLEKFIEDLRVGVVEGFLRLEDECLRALGDPSQP
jgi:hypothetical protein